jgi:hypothetical protein
MLTLDTQNCRTAAVKLETYGLEETETIEHAKVPLLTEKECYIATLNYIYRTLPLKQQLLPAVLRNVK